MKLLFCLLLVAVSAAMPVSAAQSRQRRRPRSTAPAVSRAQMELAQQMLRDAYSLGRTLPVRQRVALLTRLLYTMRPEVMATEKKQWAEELFVLAQKLPPGETVEVDSARNSAIATAAARLSIYDADRALELLDTLPGSAPRMSHGADARTMASRLVFAAYMQRHGAAAAPVLLAHGKRWSEDGEFPYSASATVVARLRPNGDAAEDFFRQVLVVFQRGRDGLAGIRDFASLLEQSVTMEAIYEETAEQAGQSIVGQLRKLAQGSSEPLTAEEKRLVVETLASVRISAPKAYEEGRRVAPDLFALQVEPESVPVEVPKVDAGLQTAFHELAQSIQQRPGPEALRAQIQSGLRLVDAKYSAGACAECASPDAQSWALVSLAAYGAPLTIAGQLNVIEDPFWRAYFLAIAAQQVAQPTRVADPAARRVVTKEEAEPE